MLIEIKYGIGYGEHTTDMDVPDDATDEEIASFVEDAILERAWWTWGRSE